MIHRFTRNGIYFIIDTNSGAIHLPDEMAYAVSEYIEPPMVEHCPEDIIDKVQRRFGEKCNRDDIIEAYDELYTLYQEGSFFSKDDYFSIPTPVTTPIKALCLHVSHDCNLRCSYCFASTGDFGTGRKIMDFETAKKAIDFVIARSAARRNIEVDFFGGEPLMAFDVVKKTVEYAKVEGEKHNKNFRFTITTNGVLLDDEIIEYVNREMSNVVLSLDGRKCVNDNIRKTVNGKGSYDHIVPKFQKLASTRGDKDYYVRGTFTHFNTDFSEDALHMAELGFDQISIEPVVSSPELPWALSEDDIPVIMEQYEKLSDKLLDLDRSGKHVNFFHFMVDLDQGPCVYKRLRGCGAGSEYVAITPEGDIYPCHQFVGMPDYKLGNLYDNSFNSDLSRKFGSLNVYTREDCADCWAKFYCSGGCNASNLLVNGRIEKPYALGCDLERKRLECAIYMKAVKALEESEE